MANNTVHTITLSGYTATTGGNCWALQLGTWASYGIEQIQLALGPEWEGLVITATFTPPKGRKAVKVVVDSSGLFDVPQEATALSGQGTITFAGNTSGQQRISVDVPYVVANHAAVDGVTPDPTPSEWAQFVAQVQQARDDAEAAAQAAEGSQTAAAESASAAAESAQEAQNIVDGAVQDIATAKDAAVQAVNDAGNTAVQAVQTAQTEGVKAVNDAGDAKVEEIEQINALVPTPTPEDAGKVVVVKPDGTGYELGDAGSEIDDAVVAPDTTWSSLNIVNKLCPPFSVTGAAVQFSPVEGYPLSVQSTIVATQSGDGDPSPENVRPIVQVEQVGVWVGGKNLLNLEGREVITDAPFANTSVRELNGNRLFVGLTSNNYFSNRQILSYAVNKDSVSVEPDANGYGLGFDFPVTPGTQLFASPSASGMLLQLSFYDKDGNYISQVLQNQGVVPENAVWGMAIFRPAPGSAVEYQNPQVEIGSAATAYEPYRGQLYTAQLPEPCYGGTVDLTDGKFSKTFGVTVVDGTTVKFTANAENPFYNLPFNSSPNVDQHATDNILSSHFPYIIWDKNETYDFIYSTAKKMAPYFSNVDELNAYCQQQYTAGTPVTIAYPLSTAETVGIDPLTIPAPASPATAYSTSGEITVSGRSDPTVLIQQMQSRLAALESAQTGI